MSTMAAYDPYAHLRKGAYWPPRRPWSIEASTPQVVITVELLLMALAASRCQQSGTGWDNRHRRIDELLDKWFEATT